jgi:hypothetical protein
MIEGGLTEDGLAGAAGRLARDVAHLRRVARPIAGAREEPPPSGARE